MYDELLDLYDDYVTKNKLADNFFVNQVFVIVDRYHPLGKFLKEVYIHETESDYSAITKTINISLKRALKTTYSMVNILKDDYVYLYNLVVLNTIFHELEHVYQEEVKDKGEENIETFLLVLSDPLRVVDANLDYNNIINCIKTKLKCRRQGKYYNKNHDIAPYERLANLRAYRNTVVLLSDYDNMNRGISMYYDLVTHLTNVTLLSGYKLEGEKTNSPSLDYLAGMKGTDNKIFVKFRGFHDENMSKENRLLYGLELSKDEFRELLTIIDSSSDFLTTQNKIR